MSLNFQLSTATDTSSTSAYNGACTRITLMLQPVLALLPWHVSLLCTHQMVGRNRYIKLAHMTFVPPGQKLIACL